MHVPQDEIWADQMLDYAHNYGDFQAPENSLEKRLSPAQSTMLKLHQEESYEKQIHGQGEDCHEVEFLV